MKLKCRICKRKRATLTIGRIHYCDECFLRIYERKVDRVIKKFGLLNPKDKVVVAVSGGKDSTSCAYLLKKFEKKYDITVEALHINLNIRNYSDEVEDATKKLCINNDIPLHIVNIKDYISANVRTLSNRTSRPICSICGTIKRYIMNKTARILGATKLATGHNMDDILEFFFKNWIGRNYNWISKLKPITESNHPRVISKIRPLYECSENENRHYAILNDISFRKIKCPYSMRNRWKDAINTFESMISNFKINFLKSLQEFEFPEIKEKINECKLCGEITNMEVCSFCRISKLESTKSD